MFNRFFTETPEEREYREEKERKKSGTSNNDHYDYTSPIQKVQKSTADNLLDTYAGAAKTLRENKGDINACACSHHLARTLLEADRGDYGNRYRGCLKDEDALKKFAASRARDMNK